VLLLLRPTRLVRAGFSGNPAFGSRRSGPLSRFRLSSVLGRLLRHGVGRWRGGALLLPVGSGPLLLLRHVQSIL